MEGQINQSKSVKKYVPISRRKVARIGDICKGVKVEEAKYRLSFFPQRAAREVLEGIKTAENSFMGKFPNSDIGNLVVELVAADKGPSMKRMIYRARGSADRIQKRSCHLTVVVSEKPVRNTVKKEVKAEEGKKQ